PPFTSFALRARFARFTLFALRASVARRALFALTWLGLAPEDVPGPTRAARRFVRANLADAPLVFTPLHDAQLISRVLSGGGPPDCRAGGGPRHEEDWKLGRG